MDPEHDGVIIKNIREGIAKQIPNRPSTTDYIATKPNQIKLADAITRDDAGNMIPLSQRDNFGVGDIRYDMSYDNQISTI